MSFEEEFDKILRQKAEGAEFPVDDANFDKLAAMLDSRSTIVTRSVWKRLWIPALAVLVSGTAGLLLYQSSSSNSSVNSTSSNSRPTNISRGIASVNSLESESTAPQAELSENRHRLVSNDQNSLLVNGSAPIESKIEKPAPSENTKTTRAIPAEIKQSAATIKTSKMDVPATAVTGTLSYENHTNEIKIESFKTSVSDENTDEQQSTSSVSVNSTMVLPLHIEHTNTTSESETTDAVSTSQNASTSEKNVEVLFAEWLPSKFLYLSSVSEPSIVSPDIQIIKRYDDDYYNPFGVRNFITLNGGVHYGLGWSNGNSKDGAGTNYFIGADYGRYLTKKTSLTCGLQYYNFTNIQQPYYSANRKAYGFGYTDAVTTVTTDQLRYLAIPIKFSYALSQTLSAGLGLNAAYLMSAHTRIDSYGVSDGVRGPVSSQGSKKVFDGTSDYNVMGSVFINVKLQNRISGFAELQYGLTDLFKDYTAVKINQRTTGLRFGISFLLFEK